MRGVLPARCLAFRGSRPALNFARNTPVMAAMLALPSFPRSALVPLPAVAWRGFGVRPRGRGDDGLGARDSDGFRVEDDFGADWAAPTSLGSRSGAASRVPARQRPKNEAWKKGKQPQSGAPERIANEALRQLNFDQVRLLSAEGQQLGLMTIAEALIKRDEAIENGKWYKDYNIELIHRDAVPPVVRFNIVPKLDENGEPLVMDRAARTKLKQVKAKAPKKTKAIAFRATIAEGDVQVKCNKMHDLLARGHPVVMRLEFNHKFQFDRHIAIAMMRNFIERVSDVAWPSSPVRRGYSTVTTLSPLRQPKPEADWEKMWEKFQLPIERDEEGNIIE